MKENDLLNRTFVFGVNCLKFLKTLPNSYEINVVKVQLSKSSTSIGANYEESQAGSSRADFRNKIRIALREARETNYWLRIIKELEVSDNDKLSGLLQESLEIKNILGAILNKTKED
ncbi:MULTISPECIES: four helix bundle protein [Epilithonimonas]|uniref:Four helix bundle protein n=2 Tax=Epilithonimonas TaxID=2782229 RepID=A0A1H6IS78_9FLAO|nr:MULTISPECIES: four helix bundle protein [Epilithonimonas]AZI54468.1 four helix bundle protein [Epilithonimonas vandammei]ROI13588.1 four helix bundle protein [Epilithonimonas hominis]SEH49232.1 four helix bundle protein [Epilithonimonas hominis]HAP95588.1 four helix bundle protein [Chryseobacterium sp.]